MNSFPRSINFLSSSWSLFNCINNTFSRTSKCSLTENDISFIIFFYIVDCTSYFFTFLFTISFYINIDYLFSFLFFICSTCSIWFCMNMAIDISFSIICSIDDIVWWSSIWIVLESFITSFIHNVITW